MKYLHIQIRGTSWVVNEKGEIAPYRYLDPQPFSAQWLFLGVSTHHWHNHIIHHLPEIFQNPKLAKGGYFWDLDHGTVRTWGKSRIQSASVSDQQC
jgi:hypothetical protein